MNKLEAKIRQRWTKWILFHLFFIAGCVCVMMAPVDASAHGAFADPSGVGLIVGGTTIDTTKLPANYFTTNDCATASCADLLIIPTTDDFSTNYTCIGTYIGYSTPGVVTHNIFHDAVTSGISGLGIRPNGIYNAECYYGGAWHAGWKQFLSAVNYTTPANCDNAVYSTFDLYNGPNTLSGLVGGYGFGTVTPNQFVCPKNNTTFSGNPNAETLTLKRSGTGPVLTTQTVTMSGSIAHASYNYNHVFFWEDMREILQNNDPITGAPFYTVLVNSGSIANPYTFTHTFHYSGGYIPAIIYADCDIDTFQSSPGSCHYKQANLDAITDPDTSALTVNSPSQLSLNNIFSSPLTNVNVGDSVPFHYSLDPNVCHNATNTDRGTISSVYFYSGESLNVMSGSGVTAHSNFSYSYLQPGLNSLGVATPYLAVVCSADTTAWTNYRQPSFNVWLGGSLAAAEALTIHVNEPSTPVSPVLQNADYVNGGQSSSFGTGTGHNFLFFADRFTAAQGETINLHAKYFVPYSVRYVYLHTDTVNDVNNPILIGTGSSKGKDLYTAIRYTSPGVVRPFIVVESTAYNSGDSSTFDIFYLGGTTNVQLADTITITQQVINQVSSFFDSDGIFGLSAATFRVNFGSTNNVFLVWAQDLANYLFQAALYVASFGWHYLRQSPVYTFIDQSWHPVAGSTHTLPSVIAYQPIAFTPADRTFTVSYADETASVAVKWFINIFILGEIMLFVLHSIFSPTPHVRGNK